MSLADIASALAREALGIEDRELVHRLLPMVRCFAPFGGDVAQRQPDELARRIISRKMTARLDDFSQSGIHAFNRIGGVDLGGRRIIKKKKKN